MGEYIEGDCPHKYKWMGRGRHGLSPAKIDASTDPTPNQTNGAQTVKDCKWSYREPPGY